MNTIPSKWADLLVQAGYTDPRDRVTPSLNQLSKSSGVHTTTISRLVLKGLGLSEVNMKKIAEALRVPVSDLYELSTGEKVEPLTLPKGTEKLSHREKEAVTEIIRSLINAKEHVDERSPEHDPKPVTLQAPAADDPPESASQKTNPDDAQSMYGMAARTRLVKKPQQTRNAKSNR
ncbi:helix-turn-helix transcriptional regulator [Arthrobacter sp. ISL-69]|uniref:helix-turn-helix domain-containing protein n=1 Tax=Arthrobacter sp. ISL-69 TaxID=2819113 RepID=UPI001BEBC546|nr:helix-turn-helix transcriptional regulator [Arthrobacter sp. ISL-69]MBT2537264.1 helix-turn-helix transcriptional regulator [Arthrobacter sp. ISL-69]